jgi:hypothetical protein
MSHAVKFLAAAVTMISISAGAAEPGTPSLSTTTPGKPVAKVQEARTPAKGDSAPVLWDGLSPKVIDGKARIQKQNNTLPRQFPAEIK